MLSGRVFNAFGRLKYLSILVSLFLKSVNFHLLSHYWNYCLHFLFSWQVSWPSVQVYDYNVIKCLAFYWTIGRVCMPARKAVEIGSGTRWLTFVLWMIGLQSLCVWVCFIHNGYSAIGWLVCYWQGILYKCYYHDLYISVQVK